ncbi:MAG: hypothetical protein IPK69_02025 [Phycisphaerales bacterium]|nr:MAG: hypothetical protein IPK69_02025 [Phycisphaerales bacterium]
MLSVLGRGTLVAGAIAMFGMIAGQASAGIAGYTTVNAPTKVEELSHQQIFAMLYGDTFTQNQVNFVNGAGITATRVYDFGASEPLDLASGDPLQNTDQRFSSSGPITLTARARYATDIATFGWRDDTGDGSFQSILDTRDIGADTTVTLSSNFRFALNNHRLTQNQFTSRMADNLDATETGRDQMVMYKVFNPQSPNASTWLLFWEDRIAGQDFSDYDFNDSVVELSVVPTPGSLALLATGSLLALRRRRR